MRVTQITDQPLFRILILDPEPIIFGIYGQGSISADVTSTEEPAGCTTAGTRTYTATAQLGGRTYTDTRTETIPATGHSFGEAQTTTDETGKTTIHYHCNGCNQDFDIEIGVEKE